MDIKRSSQVSVSTSSTATEANALKPQETTQIQKGVGRTIDSFDSTKSDQLRAKLTASIPSHGFALVDEKFANDTAKRILKAAGIEDNSALDLATASQLKVAAGIVAAIPTIGPVIGAVLAQVAAAIQAIQDAQAKQAENESLGPHDLVRTRKAHRPGDPD